MAQKTVAYFDSMSSTISAAARRTWDREISVAENQRLTNPSGMDILAAHEADLSRTHATHAADQRSGPKWLLMGLSMEEQQ